ncbi:MAG: nickel pincer cofactor biosynthesis protein LarB [Candidatus Thermoplasmatota archaeon]|nr:nickel pincer cofactor biosynthesis protein LarB [Candidatus Thermoplasmatota archaeon]
MDNKRELESLLDRYVNSAEDRTEIQNLIYRGYLSIGGRLKLDPLGSVRTNIPELVYAEKKSIKDIEDIINNSKISNGIIFTRVTEEQMEYFGGRVENLSVYREAHVMAYKRDIRPVYGPVGILAAGTSDTGVAEECRTVSELLGIKTEHAYCTGTVDLYRVVDAIREMENVKLFILVAGMEVALFTVVSSLTRQPIIAVPTSAGYGVSDNGKTALYSMLLSCSGAIAAVNIDGGAVAALNAFRILRMFQNGEEK